MDKIIAIVIGGLCGVGQFLLLRYKLKPLTEGNIPRIGRMLFLQFPVPLTLLLCYALINFKLLPIAGGAFCLSLIITSVLSHFTTLKKKG